MLDMEYKGGQDEKKNDEVEDLFILIQEALVQIKLRGF